MESLIELVGVASRNKVRHIEIIGEEKPGKKETKINLLYDAIREERVKSDEEAAEFLGLDVHTTAYRNVKNSLKKRLLNTIFFIDVKRAIYNEQQSAYFNCWREWAAVKILVGKGAHRSSLELCQKILQVAKEFEFVDLILDVSRQLRLYYGTIEGDKKKFEEYSQIYRCYEEALTVENRLEEYYCDLTIDSIRSKSASDETYGKAMSLLPTIDCYLARFNYFRIQFLGRMIKIAARMMKNDYRSTLETCEEGLAFFETKKFEVKIPVSAFLHQKLVCHLQLGQFEEGMDAAEKSLQLIQEGSYNWFKNHELRFLLSMHTRKYGEGYKTWDRAITNSGYKYLDESSKEKWAIYGFFLHYLFLLGKFTPDQDETRFNNFRLGKFLNQVPTYSQDKRGLNVPILIAQILFLIMKKDLDEVIDRMEAIEKYCSRYLRHDDLFRSNCFIKMLLQMPDAGFHRAAVTRKAQKYVDKLEEVPLEIAEQPFEVEIIPYLDLWQFAMDSLENKRFDVKRKKTAG
ncbi:MAG TPA: hypothetical protein PKE06_15760 [Flavilitoribacter sp.]|nr:hypothetical protein [Flavilitoribacter sp.]HMQ86602.1 hypothetical protein [Flavilitoribacter sp.]